MIPGNATDMLGLQYQNVAFENPIDVLLTNIPAQNNNGFTSTTGFYYGGAAYAGTDSQNPQALYVLGKHLHAFQVVASNALSFSVQLEGSIDGTNWFLIGAAVTAAGITQVSGTPLYKFVRLNVTAFTPVGSPAAGQPIGVSVRYIAV